MGFIKALKKEKNLFRLNRRSNMHVKWMGKMVVVVKCRFLVTLIERLHQFSVVKSNQIKSKQVYFPGHDLQTSMGSTMMRVTPGRTALKPFASKVGGG